MNDPLLRLDDLHKSFGGLKVSAGVNLAVRAGETHALIGPNGAGKTTLIAQIAGELRPDAGKIFLCGRDITRLAAHKRARLGLGRAFQVTSPMAGMTVLDNAVLAVMAQMGSPLRMWRPVRGEAAMMEEARAALARVGLAEVEEEKARDLSHGQRRQLELAMALAGRPRLLLLDEPMAGLGPRESRDMVDLLCGLKDIYAILLVEHDMDAVFALADRISVLVSGAIIATGSPRQIRADAAVRRAYLGEEDTPC